jgi:hypothetical protein
VFVCGAMWNDIDGRLYLDKFPRKCIWKSQ